MTAPVPITVFDTTIALAAALSPAGVSEKALHLIDTREVIAFTSNRLRHEYKTTLSHPAHAKRHPFMTPAYIEAFLARFDTYAERIPNPPTAMIYARDPNDEMLVNLAVAVEADFLVTLDNDLLSLPRHPDFAALPHQPQVLKPGAFLTIIEQRRQDPQPNGATNATR